MPKFLALLALIDLNCVLALILEPLRNILQLGLLWIVFGLMEEKTAEASLFRFFRVLKNSKASGSWTSLKRKGLFVMKGFAAVPSKGVLLSIFSWILIVLLKDLNKFNYKELEFNFSI